MRIFVLASRLGATSGDAPAWTRRFGHLRFHALRCFQRVKHRCDRMLRNWGARRLAREMQSWPDERLKDIGLSRAELVNAIEGVRRPFHWAPDHDERKLDATRFGH
jgi:uncharacterized protein YjiS (DUF1127 family)